MTSRNLLLLLLGVFLFNVVLVYAVYFTPRGYLSIDEVTYHAMVWNLAEGRLSIWNGYEELPSDELASPFIRPADGTLTAQYPYMFPIIAAPFYFLFGFAGLFAVNAIAYCLALVLTYRIGRRVFDDRAVAAVGAALLAIFSFLPSYAFAAWPHATAVALGLGAFHLALDAFRAPGRGAHVRALAAGLVAGVAIGVRLDCVFLAPALVLPFLIAARPRVVEPLLVALGALPPLLVMALINHARFATYSPFSYGMDIPGTTSSGIGAYLPFLFGGLIVGGGAWALSRPAFPSAWRRRLLLGAVALGLLVGTLVEPASTFLAGAARGVAAILVDMRVMDPAAMEPHHRSLGVITYDGWVKKALLQSCPWLVVIGWGFVAALRSPIERPRYLLLCIVPVVYCGAFAALQWHGGASVSMRYLLPALPFLSLLAARSVLSLVDVMPRRLALIAAGGGGGAVALAAYTIIASTTNLVELSAAALVGFRVPFVLAVLLAGALVAARAQLAARWVPVVALGAALAWSAALTHHLDAGWSSLHRLGSWQVGSWVSARITNESLLFVSPDVVPFYAVVSTRERVRFAMPKRDTFTDFRQLTEAHLRDGHRVYGALQAADWERVTNSGFLRGLTTLPLGMHRQHVWGETDIDLREVVVAPPSSPGPRQDSPLEDGVGVGAP